MNWNILYDKFGQSLSAAKFEDLSLEYVKDVYKQYEWLPTKRTRDGNKDFHLLENDLYDIWGEAKYKKKGNALSKKDLDPTILSGLMDGKVRLIIFVTNAHIPPALIDRIILGGKIRNIKISCVLASQLESWLAAHQDIYTRYFEEPFDKSQVEEDIFQIKKISFYDVVSQDFNPFEQRYKMTTDREYILSVIIYSNTQGTANFANNDNLPFVFIEHPNYDSANHAQITPGITVLTFLIIPRVSYCGCISIQLWINNEPFFFITEELEINCSDNFDLIYAQQLEQNNKIFHLLTKQDNESLRYIISIYAESGMGKTFLLKHIYNNYSLKKDITIVTFDSNRNSHINYLFLCRILLFLHYGNIFWLESLKEISEDTRSKYKQIAIRSNDQSLFSNALLSRIIDGCFDANIARGVIYSLNKKLKSEDYTLIHGYNAVLSRILILDDFQYLNSRQSTFMHHILKQLRNNKNNSILIIAATKNKFYNKEWEERFLSLTPNLFHLSGLSFEDKQSTICKNFSLPIEEFSNSIIDNLPNNVLLFCEIVRSLYQNTVAINTSADYVINYIKTAKCVNIFQNRFETASTFYYLLDIIYRFKKGISKHYFEQYPPFFNLEISKAIDFLETSHLIIEDGNLIKPYHDYLIASYRQLRNNFFNNSDVEKFLLFMLDLKDIAAETDYHYILLMVVECNPNAYKWYEKEIKKQIEIYNYKTQYDVVTYYGKIIYERLKNRAYSQFSNNDFYYLYLYGNALIHCDNSRKACDILEIVYKNADQNSLERYEAGVQLVNERYWNASPANIVEDTWILQDGIQQILQNNNKRYEKNRLLKIYSSCINRRMVTYLLLEQKDKAFQIYRSRLMELMQTYGKDYKPYSATLLMDYARGISYCNPLFAMRLLKLALNYFLTNSQIHYRRLPICYIDIEVMKSITTGNYCEETIIHYAENLLQASFYSEYFKGILKKCACQLIYMTQISDKAGIARGNSSFLGNLANEISSALITAELIPSDREVYLMNNLLAYISVMNDNLDEAVKYLEAVNSYVEEIGDTYHTIAHHNFINIYRIKKIRWYSQELLDDTSVFLLDTRFW